jgi:hypothetical protein
MLNLIDAEREQLHGTLLRTPLITPPSGWIKVADHAIKFARTSPQLGVLTVIPR